MIVLAIKKRTRMHENEGGGNWMVVVAAFFVQFIVCGITYSMGLIHVSLRQVFCESHFDTSWAVSWLLYTMALSGVIFRFIASRLGCRVSVMLGGVLAATGLSLTMVVKELYQMYFTFGVLTGLGFGLALTPSIIAVERCFHHGRFQALSCVMGGLGAGVVTFPIIIRYLLEYFAWRGTFLILGGISLNLCVCGALMRPEAKGKEVKLLPVFSCLPLRNTLFHAMCFSHLFWSFGTTVIYLYLPSYAMSQGTDFQTTAFLISCIGLSSFMCRMIFAFMGSNSAMDNVTEILCSVFIGIVITGICPLLFERYSGQVGYTILFGFYSGFWTTFLSQVSRELIGPQYIALGTGYLCFMIGLGCLLGGPLAGLLLQEEKMFKYVFYLAGGCLVMSSSLMTVFKVIRCGNQPDYNTLNKADKPLPILPEDCYRKSTSTIESDSSTPSSGRESLFSGHADVIVEAIVTNV